MGQDIRSAHFAARDFARFERALREETQHAHDLFERGGFSAREPMVGLELEAWLVDREGRPAPRNEEFLARLQSSDVVTELGRFQFELNVPPQPLAGTGLSRLAQGFQATWSACCRTAAEMGLRALAIGILPTLRDDDLCLANISNRARYRALNEQVLRSRAGRPIRLDIEGTDGARLRSEHRDVMLEAGTTSLQAHLQTPPQWAARAYNASIIASAATVALAANAPMLFGHRLAHDTRIALFEQALDIGTREGSYRGIVPRVTFGTGYAGYSLAECFRENLDLFPVMLPIVSSEPSVRLAHLRLHNGTIWRWNRALIGFDGDGTPHLRVEHRPMSAGPTIADMMANLAFYYGLVGWLVQCDEPPELRLPFHAARANLYAAARFGLAAEVHWLDGDRVRIGELVTESLLDHAAAGLDRFGVDAAWAKRTLQLIADRAEMGQTGAVWQRRWLSRHGPDMTALTDAYASRQVDGAPVHQWDTAS
ncbi:MAG TPA: hypothetical protein VMU33_03265 [Burkholderiaceae bacterium]|nr:hypothetical protein [Burkholderiaceae bacterium]